MNSKACNYYYTICAHGHVIVMSKIMSCPTSSGAVGTCTCRTVVCRLPHHMYMCMYMYMIKSGGPEQARQTLDSYMYFWSSEVPLGELQ